MKPYASGVYRLGFVAGAGAEGAHHVYMPLG